MDWKYVFSHFRLNEIRNSEEIDKVFHKQKFCIHLIRNYTTIINSLIEQNEMQFKHFVVIRNSFILLFVLSYYYYQDNIQLFWIFGIMNKADMLIAIIGLIYFTKKEKINS